MPKLNLTRDVLSQIAQGNQRAVLALEQVLGDVGETFPATIEEANALAGAALAAAQSAAAALSILAAAVSQLEGAPATMPHIDPDDTAPRAHLGTISTQNADTIEVTGGTIDGTSVGATTAAAAKFTTISASDQITSTVADGTAPFVVTSKTLVANLHAAVADSLGTATAYPANATDLASCIALANALKAANTAKGV